MERFVRELEAQIAGMSEENRAALAASVRAITEGTAVLKPLVKFSLPSVVMLLGSLTVSIQTGKGLESFLLKARTVAGKGSHVDRLIQTIKG